MTRHGSLAEQLTAIKAAMNRPEGPVETLETNWSNIAANDNNPEDLAGKHVERRWAIRPTPAEIMKQVEDGEVVRNKAGQIVSICKLEFSDGTATEKAYTYGADGKLIMYDAPMPVGAMLKTKDAQERMLGGDGLAPSNRIYTAIYKAKHHGKAIRKDRERVKLERAEAKNLTKSELQDELEAAIANTSEMPVVTVCPKSFPWKPGNLRELFMGVEKGKKGESGSIAWQDISTHIVEREVWHETIAALSADDQDALKALETARSVADLVPPAPKRTAIRKGKARLVALNDNIDAAYKKSAA